MWIMRWYIVFLSIQFMFFCRYEFFVQFKNDFIMLFTVAIGWLLQLHQGNIVQCKISP